MRGLPGRRLSPEQERARAQRVELLSLFALGRDFQLRLSAQVASAWSGRRPPRGTPKPGPARTAGPGRRADRPAGPGRRAVGSASTRTWSGPPCTRVPGWGSVARDGPGLRAALPLSWLARVWAPGFPVVDGHLVVDVLAVSWPQVQVLGLPAPGAEPAVLSIQADGEHWSRARGER